MGTQWGPTRTTQGQYPNDWFAPTSSRMDFYMTFTPPHPGSNFQHMNLWRIQSSRARSTEPMPCDPFLSDLPTSLSTIAFSGFTLPLDFTSEPCPSTLSMNQITLPCSLFGYRITSISPRFKHYPSLFTSLKLAFKLTFLVLQLLLRF